MKIKRRNYNTHNLIVYFDSYIPIIMNFPIVSVYI